MQLARELARRSAALRFENLPADAVHWAKIGILDTVGSSINVVIVPAREEELLNLKRVLGMSGMTSSSRCATSTAERKRRESYRHARERGSGAHRLWKGRLIGLRLIHSATQAERAHIGPDPLDMRKAKLFRAMHTHVTPTGRNVLVTGPD
jgi:hypothetical protein